jgi:hypothetical protein
VNKRYRKKLLYKGVKQSITAITVATGGPTGGILQKFNAVIESVVPGVSADVTLQVGCKLLLLELTAAAISDEVARSSAIKQALWLCFPRLLKDFVPETIVGSIQA